jgi:hypothetical protein
MIKLINNNKDVIGFFHNDFETIADACISEHNDGLNISPDQMLYHPEVLSKKQDEMADYIKVFILNDAFIVESLNPKSPIFNEKEFIKLAFTQGEVITLKQYQNMINTGTTLKHATIYFK